MPDTHGFEVVAEVSDEVLQRFLEAAWTNGGTSDAGTIPHEVVIPAGITFPGTTWAVDHGQVQIPQTGLSLVMAPADNGVTVGLSVTAQVAMDATTIPVPSLALFDMAADISITAPFGIIPGTENNIGFILEGLPRNKVIVNITSGDPIGPVTLDMISEHIHQQYMDETIPHTQTQTGVSLGAYSADVLIELFDDQIDPNYQITVASVAGNQVKISIPIHLSMSNVQISGSPIQPLSPMGVLARIAMTVPLVTTSGSITAQLSSATVAVEKFDGAPCAGGNYCDPATSPCLTPATNPAIEGSNYSTNKVGGCAFGVDLESLLISSIQAQGLSLVSSMGDFTTTLPTESDIEAFIGDHVHAAIVDRSYIGVWTPETPEGSSVVINEARPKALSDALAIAINPGSSANENGLGNFIPNNRPFAIALDAALVMQVIGEVINRPEAEGGFGGIPRHFNNIEGHAADLTSMSWELTNGAIRFSGNVTVHDVFCGADADCSFWADIGLSWSAPDATGAQILVPELIDSDVDLPWWAWLLAVLGFLFGLILGVIAIVMTVVVEDIAERVGGEVMEDEVGGQMQALGSWPQHLQGIGEVTSIFHHDVGIDSTGLLFSGESI